ncbi:MULTISPECIES: SDR family NAD(P)-dependent oxidoreductase [unclassified Chitinophaga]|uniref:SDR family NAD(P)-dependent oxidoreductase n=1 Tax=unclassified Chitinophaga TaxID=2619133 RepID=UPI0030105DF6
MKRFDNKVAVITGGNGGIGLAAAKLFIAHGAHVYITGRRQEQLDDAVAQIGSNVTAIKGDVSNLTDLDHLISEVKHRKCLISAESIISQPMLR